ncbi:hypothetical protein B5M42_019580 [Paenibacillus athensensis]|uniref:HNH nuclease domain-containing protein n=1 Tax=Paenibacillus athensensis TaxID=1967502 RepID=A0A4Y8Q2U3_9BACL|nr:hypothetical protein [Paenibacillus athensensis]MCD1261008.1 hypothetical protein [Paenibacillus athensensis]
MIKIERTDLPAIADTHYRDYFVGCGFERKLERLAQREPDAVERAFFAWLHDRAPELITARPARLHELTVEARATHPDIHQWLASLTPLKRETKSVKKRFEQAAEHHDRLTAEPHRHAAEDIRRALDGKQALLDQYRTLQQETGRIEGLLGKIQSVFNYDDFCDRYEDEEWGAYALVKRLRIPVCPYCNRQYITVVEPVLGEKGRARPQLDHFFAQSHFPYLAVSLYNLIPSCSVCNASLKRNQMFTWDDHIHPYEGGFGDDVRFTVKFPAGKGKLDYLKMWYREQGDLRVELLLDPAVRRRLDRDELKRLLRRVNNHKRIFKLKSLYASHGDYVQEIILKSIWYNDAKLDAMQRQFPHLFPTKEHLARLVFGNFMHTEEAEKRVLSKLTRDVAREFGITL